jgi:hypothetical protein
MSREALARHGAEREELPVVAHAARAEVATIDRILDRREDMALAAARVSPGAYLLVELGERPTDGSEQVAWDRAAREVEGHRQRNGIEDRDTALGPEPKGRPERLEHERVQRSITRAQRELGIERAQAIDRYRGMEIEL